MTAGQVHDSQWLKPVITGSASSKSENTSIPRSLVEQAIGWLKECRRAGTGFKKSAINFAAMEKLAVVNRALKIMLSNKA